MSTWTDRADFEQSRADVEMLDPLPDHPRKLPEPKPPARCDECGNTLDGVVAVVHHYTDRHPTP